MELTNRLKMLTSFVDKGMKVADVGCDHGYVPIYLIKEGIASYALAMDINRDPLEKAKNNAIAYKVSDGFDTRLSNGIKELKNFEVDCVIIAGMGGKLIENILTNDADKLKSYKRLILSPHKDIMSVRKKLKDLNIPIVNETMLYEEGHYYNFIIAEPGGLESDSLKFDEDNDLLQLITNKYGKILIMNKNQVLSRQISEWLPKQEVLLNDLKAKNVSSRVKELSEEIRIGKKVLSWLT